MKTIVFLFAVVLHVGCSASYDSVDYSESHLESELTSAGYTSTELMAHLVGETKTEVVDFGLTSFHQRENKRKMDSLHIVMYTEVELPLGMYSSVHIIKPSTVCAVTGILARIFCYSIDTQKWTTLGGGTGVGPTEVRILNGFAYNEADDSYLMLDGQRNISKILEKDTIYRQQVINKRGMLNPVFLDEKTVLFNPIVPLREDPAIQKWDLTSNELLPFAYLPPSKLGGHILAIDAPYISMQKVGDDRLVVAYWYWGVFSLYDGSGNRLITRSMIQNNHDQPNYFVAMHGQPNYFYQERYTRNYRWTHAFNVDDRYLINMQIDTDRKTYLDFYNKQNGEYQFSSNFRRGGSTVKMDIKYGLIANLTGEGTIQIYKYQYVD